jgi:hypothetical protein
MLPVSVFNWRGSNVDVGCLCIAFTRVMLLGSLDAKSLFQRLDRCDANCSLYFHVLISLLSGLSLYAVSFDCSPLFSLTL